MRLFSKEDAGLNFFHCEDENGIGFRVSALPESWGQKDRDFIFPVLDESATHLTLTFGGNWGRLGQLTPASSTGRLEAYRIEGEAYRMDETIDPPANRRQERRRPDLTHTESHGGGPRPPFAGPAVKLSAVRDDASILTPRTATLFGRCTRAVHGDSARSPT